MILFKRIEHDYLVAYKAQDQEFLSVLRLLKTAIKNRQVELKKPLDPLDDAAMLDIIGKQAKQRQDSIEQFTNAGREDLALKERTELSILRKYLPEPLSPKEMEKAVDEAISSLGAADMKQMGEVIKAVMSKFQGQVDGKTVSLLVRTKLS